jgi:hypothetical protein
VIPVVDKIPKIKQWQRGGLRAPNSIRKVFERLEASHHDNLGIGIPTGFPLDDGGHLMVLDVDRRSGGEEALAELPPLPETAMARTKDGNHYWFRTDKPFASTVRPDGLELKGAGSYVEVPPSKDKFWERAPYNAGIADAPDWLIQRPPEPEKQGIASFSNPETTETSLIRGNWVSPIKGQRTLSLLRAAASWARRGWVSEHHKLMLLGMAINVGLEHKRALEVINYSFRTIATVATATAAATAGEEAGGAYTSIVRFSKMDFKVFKTALEEIKKRNTGNGRI